MAEAHQYKTLSRHLRIGLQIKSVLILAALSIGITAAGGWLYYNGVSKSLHDNDFRHVTWTGQALALAEVGTGMEAAPEHDTALKQSVPRERALSPDKNGCMNPTA